MKRELWWGWRVLRGGAWPTEVLGSLGQGVRHRSGSGRTVRAPVRLKGKGEGKAIAVVQAGKGGDTVRMREGVQSTPERTRSHPH